VGDYVPETGVVRPRHLWRGAAKVDVDGLRCFANDEKVEENRVENDFGPDIWLNERSPDMIVNCLDGLGDVSEAISGLARHIGMASRSASMRAGSRSMSVVATSTGAPSASLSSRRKATRSNSVRPGSRSTNRSMSLSGLA